METLRALLASFVLTFGLSACVPELAEPEPLRVAVLLVAEDGQHAEDSVARHRRTYDWALEAVNAAGGVADRPLAVEYVTTSAEQLDATAEDLAEDEEILAVIAPPGSEALAQLAPTFVEAGKPLLSTTSTSEALLRAYGGEGEIWRLRESDIAQTELLLRYAREQQAMRVTLLTGVDAATLTFFNWFGFFATELGYPSEAFEIVTLDPEQGCLGAVKQALDTLPELLFVAPDSMGTLTCIVNSLPPADKRPRVVLADTGLDANALLMLGEASEGVEGFSAAGLEAFTAAFVERYPDERLPPHGASEYDALLLLAYGLERAEGIGGQALIHAMKQLVDGREDSVGSWDAQGVDATLAAIRAGASPLLQGATGPLMFEPELYMDLAASTLGHYRVRMGELVYDASYTTGDPTFLTSGGAFVPPQMPPGPADDSSWTPDTPRSETWAVVAALSSGWFNYRHQADALRQYWLLRDAGVEDDHIILILADDLADAANNGAPGEVRNELEGEDLYAGATIDYDLSLSPEQLEDILTGKVTQATPTVIEPGASSNVYLYFAGHGGASGIPFGAESTLEGLAETDESLSPTRLRESLCALQEQDAMRRALVVIESCYAGVFGEADSDGLEFGCGASEGELPLEGVVLMTAANAKEVSYASVYDAGLDAWLSDEFSASFAAELETNFGRNLADVYTDVYAGTPGSHPSLFNTASSGPLSAITLREFFGP